MHSKYILSSNIMTDPIQSVSKVEKSEFVLPVYGEYFKKIDIDNQTVYLQEDIEQDENEAKERILITQDYMAFLTSAKRNVWEIDEEALKALVEKGNTLSEEFINCDSEDSFRDLKEEEGEIQIEITPIADDYELKGLLDTQINHRLYP